MRSLVCAIYVDTLLVRFFFNWSQSRIVLLKQKETVIAFHKQFCNYKGIKPIITRINGGNYLIESLEKGPIDWKELFEFGYQIPKID